LKEIARYPLISYEESASPYFAEMVQGIFAREKITPNIVQKSRLPSILTLVEAGVGVAIAPASMARARAASLTWSSISAINLPVAQVIVAASREASNPVIQSFVGSLLGGRTRGTF
jgi:DNA-binding transcriptional LysR family regulator